LDQQVNWFEESLQKWIFEPAKLLLDTGNESVDFAGYVLCEMDLPEMG